MSRYDIAIDKKDGNFKKIKKAIAKKSADFVTRSGKVSGIDTTAVPSTAPRNTPTGGESSTEFLRLVGMMRDRLSSNGVQGETGVSAPQGETGVYAESNEERYRAPGLYMDGGGPGISLYVNGGPIPLQISSQNDNVGFGLAPTQRVPDELNIAGGAVSQQDGTITTRVPVSRFVTITGPSGDRVMIPLRMLNYRIDDENGEKRISIKLSNQQASSLNSDILQGIRRTTQ